ncbi:hypothetical protein Sjap_024657 [Stephania japonica]|uniref:SHSP domain-containing protein n=1 Tax=Stephania japonica TaxID=461633 RepID=A0AAP0EDS9_9MAGN
MADSFFGDPLKKILLSTPSTREWTGSLALMDWLETPTSHIFKINVPGYSKDDVKVQIEEQGNVLHISGGAPKEEDSEAMKDAIWRVSERGAMKGEFSRVISLPGNLKLDEISAHVDNGVLTVVVPKDQAPKSSKARPINVLSKI